MQTKTIIKEKQLLESILVLDKNTWNYATVYKLFVLDWTTYSHITMWKEMIIN